MAGSFYDRDAYYSGEKTMKDLHKDEEKARKKAKVFKEKNNMPTKKTSTSSRSRRRRRRNSLDTKKNISQSDKKVQPTKKTSTSSRSRRRRRNSLDTKKNISQRVLSDKKVQPTTNPTVKKIEKEVKKAYNNKSITNKSGNELTKEQKQKKKQVETALMKKYSDYQTKVETINDIYNKEQAKRGKGIIKTGLGLLFGSPKIAISGLNETLKKGSLTNYEKQFLKNKTLEEMTVYTDDQADMVREKQKQFSPSGTSQKRRRYTSKSITPTDGDNTDGDITDGDITDGYITDGYITDGDITDGYITDGDITDGSGSLNDFALAGGQQETANNSKKLLGLTAVLAGGYLLYTYM